MKYLVETVEGIYWITKQEELGGKIKELSCVIIEQFFSSDSLDVNENEVFLI